MRSFAVRRTRLALAAGLVLCLCAVPALAAPTKGYVVKVGGTAVAGQDVAFNVTFSVPTTQQQQLGSADLTVPPGFGLIGATIVAPGIGTATPNGSTIQLRNLALQPGQSLTVQVRASVPCRAKDSPPMDRLWSVLGKQANDFNGSPGNALVLNSRDSLLNTPVAGFCTNCDPNAQCEPATVKTGTSDLTVQGNIGPGEDRVTLALGAGPQIDCPNYGEVVSQTSLFDVSGDRDKTLTAQVPSKDFPKGGLNGLEFCFGSPDPFTTKSGATAPAQGSYDFNGDGTAEPVYVGLLPDCAGGPAPCVVGRTRAGNGGFIQAQLPEGDPAARH
jgi:hypothetical protein